MRTLLSRIGGLALGLLIVAGVARADEPVTLKYKWNKGDVIAYRITNATRSKLIGTPQGDIDGLVHDQVMISRMLVTDVAADGAATVAVHFDSMKVSMSQPGMMPMSYDSDVPPVEGAPMNPMAASFGAMIGESVTFVVEPTGAVRSSKGMEKIMTKIVDAIEKEQPGRGAEVRNGLAATFGDEAMRRMYEQALKILPSNPVKVGDSWSVSMDQPVPPLGTMRNELTHTFQGLENADGRRVAKIANASKIAFEPAKDNATGLTATSTDARGNGTNLFDVERGQLHRGTVTVVMPLTISGTQQGQRFTSNQIFTTNMVVERIENYTPPARKPAAATPAPAPAAPADGEKKN